MTKRPIADLIPQLIKRWNRSPRLAHRKALCPESRKLSGDCALLCRLLFALTVALGLAPIRAASATEYNFHLIDGSTNKTLVLNRYEPQIDALGRVYFNTQDNSTTSSIIRGTPDSFEVLVNSATNKLHNVAFEGVNAVGDITYTQHFTSPPILYRRTDDGTTTVVPFFDPAFQDYGGLPRSTNRWWINDSGVVTYNGRFGSLKAIGSSLNTNEPLAVTDGQPFNKFELSGQTSIVVQNGSAMNNAGDVVFWAGTDEFELNLYRVSQDGSIATIYDKDESGLFSNVAATVDMNNDGTVVIAGLYNDQDVIAIYKIKDGALSLVMDTTGGFGTFGGTVFDINDAGKVAFFTQLDTFNPPLSDYDLGIFDGPDPISNKVIQTGDSLAGSTVLDLKFYRGLNDAGQIAFWASLTDGRTAMFRADPIPEPSTLALAGIGALALLAYGARRRRGDTKGRYKGDIRFLR